MEPSASSVSTTVCKLCRQRKTRCNRKLPKCDSCAKANVDCHYVKDKSKPGLRAGYVTSLEERLNKLEKEVQFLKANRCTHEPTQVALFQQTDTDSIPSNESPRTPATYGQNSPASARQPPSTFDPLSPTVLDELCTAWFEKYHPWFPILHQPSLLDALQASPDPSNTPYHPVLKSLVAVTIPHDYRSFEPSQEYRHRISEILRNEVLMETISHLSLPSLQAILILTINYYGAGRLKEYWNLVALAKRMATQLGYRDLVANHCANFNHVSTLPPRMLPFPASLVDREEKIRAYWMTELLDNASTIGVAWNVTVSQPSTTGLLPCSDAAWAFPEAVISAWPFDDLATSSTYSLYVMLITNELFHVHAFLQQSYDLTSTEERARRRKDCITVDSELVTWRARFEAMEAQEGFELHDSNSVLIRCALDLATISLYQSLILPPQEGTPGTWNHALNRCLEACSSTVQVLLRLPSMTLQNISPLIIPCITVAARFCLLHAKLFSTAPSPNFELLATKLEVCAVRWPYARRLTKVLRAAVTDQGVLHVAADLPVQFWDMQYSYLDIDEALRVWAEG